MAAAQDQRLDYRTIRTKPMLVKQMRKRKMKHFGHIIRHNSLEKTIIQGITAGKIGRGRPARTWEKDIEEWARANIGEQPEWQRGGICGALPSTSQKLNLEPSEQREREKEMPCSLTYVASQRLTGHNQER